MLVGPMVAPRKFPGSPHAQLSLRAGSPPYTDFTPPPPALGTGSLHPGPWPQGPLRLGNLPLSLNPSLSCDRHPPCPPASFFPLSLSRMSLSFLKPHCPESFTWTHSYKHCCHPTLTQKEPSVESPPNLKKASVASVPSPCATNLLSGICKLSPLLSQWPPVTNSTSAPGASHPPPHTSGLPDRSWNVLHLQLGCRSDVHFIILKYTYTLHVLFACIVKFFQNKI